jgi:hypothetical protein
MRAPRPDPKAADELMSVHMKRDIKRAPDLLESAPLPCAVGHNPRLDPALPGQPSRSAPPARRSPKP